MPGARRRCRRRGRAGHARRARRAHTRERAAADGRRRRRAAVLQDNRVALPRPGRRRWWSPTRWSRRVPRPQALPVSYDAEPHDVILRADHPGMYAPEPRQPELRHRHRYRGCRGGPAAAAVQVDETYSTRPSTTTRWSRTPRSRAGTMTALTVCGLQPGANRCSPGAGDAVRAAKPSAVRVITAPVGGGFGAKGSTRPHTVLAAMAARVVGRPVQVTFTRQQSSAWWATARPRSSRCGWAPTPTARLVPSITIAYAQTSTVMEFAEQTAVISRVMYAAPNLRTRHRLVALDVPTPRWMRAPGECPGIVRARVRHGRAGRCVRHRPDRAAGPQRACRRAGGRPPVQQPPPARLPAEGARRFGWAERDPVPACAGTGGG